MIVGLLISNLYDLFFILSLIFIALDHITPLKQTYLYFKNISHYSWTIAWMKKTSTF